MQTNHKLHLGLTIATLGLLGVSWIALAVGRRISPWRCGQCGSSEPDFSKARRSGGDSGGSASGA